jgi:hypothetical protein
MRINKLNRLTIMVVTVLTTTLSGVPATALGMISSHANARASNNSSQAADHVAAAQTRLADAKLRACQNREKAINNIMGRIATRGQKQLDLFSTIATRVETFYTDKGKVLSNYDALVADVDAKKTAAQAVVDTIKSDSVSFSCDGSDPKGFVSLFKDNLKSEISALKDYRTSVKNLIVGVKSVQGSTTSTENSSTEGSQ